MPKKLKEDIRGEGKQLYNAIRASNMSVNDVLAKAGIVKQTLYNYYRKEELDDDIKEQFALILMQPKEDIFGLKSTNNTNLLAQLKSAWDKYIKGIGLEDESTSRANRKQVDDIMQQIDETKEKIDKAQGK